MTWQTRLQDATFRGVPFFVDGAEQLSGRRAVVHEFPLRDVPQTEDMGRRATGYTLDAYVIGPDYFGARDALISALQAPGPGTLVHPYLGQLQVQIGEVRWSETTREGGYCKFSIQCWESAPVVYPRPVVDTRSSLRTQCDAADAAAADDYAERVAVDDQPQRVLDAAQAQARAAAAAVESAAATMSTLPAEITELADLADRFSSAVSSLVIAPVTLAGQLQSLVTQMSVAAARPSAAFDALQLMFGFGDDDAAISADTLSAAAQAANQSAISDLLQQAATVEACRVSASVDFDSADAAIAARDVLIAQIDKLIDSDIGDALYQALTGVRAAVIRDIGERVAQLPFVLRITLAEPLPALFVAQQRYGDASRSDEIARRNAAHDPLFMPAGEPLEVLSV